MLTLFQKFFFDKFREYIYSETDLTITVVIYMSYLLSARAGNFGRRRSLEGRSKKYLSGSGFTGCTISFNDWVSRACHIHTAIMWSYNISLSIQSKMLSHLCSLSIHADLIISSHQTYFKGKLVYKDYQSGKYASLLTQASINLFKLR